MKERLRTSSVPDVAVLAALLLAFFLSIYLFRDLEFPVGSDAPVYLWWTRLAAHDGLSAVGMRPGVPALMLVLTAALPITEVEALAAIGAAFATSVGLGAWALIGRDRPRGVALLAALMAGTFAADLAGGYYANLLFSALFLAGAVALAAGTGRGVVAAAVLLAGAVLAHPLFAPAGLAILALAALPTLRRGRPLGTEGGRIGAAVLGGGLLAGAALLLLLPGAGPLRVDTSADAFRRRAGLQGPLRASYLHRFVVRWPRYVLPVSVPLAALGLAEARGFASRFLGAWGVVTVVGVGAALATGLVPAHRWLGFSVALPILAVLGLVRLRRLLGPRRRWLAGAVTVVLLAALLAGAAVPWRRLQPFLSSTEVARATTAGRIAAAAPPGTPLVFLVNDDDPDRVPFELVRAANIVRAALPPDRIRDVYPAVGSPVDLLAGRPTAIGVPEYDAASRLYLGDIRTAEASSGRALLFVLAPFNRPDHEAARSIGRQVSDGVFLLGPGPSPVPEPVDPLRPSNGRRIALAALATLALLTAVGLGWSRLALGGGAGSLALAPAFGAAGLLAVGIALERAGLALHGAGGALASALAGAGGYAAALLERRARSEARPEVTDRPGQDREDHRRAHVVREQGHPVEEPRELAPLGHRQRDRRQGGEGHDPDAGDGGKDPR